MGQAVGFAVAGGECGGGALTVRFARTAHGSAHAGGHGVQGPLVAGGLASESADRRRESRPAAVCRTRSARHWARQCCVTSKLCVGHPLLRRRAAGAAGGATRAAWAGTAVSRLAA